MITVTCKMLEKALRWFLFVFEGNIKSWRQVLQFGFTALLFPHALLKISHSFRLESEMYRPAGRFAMKHKYSSSLVQGFFLFFIFLRDQNKKTGRFSSSSPSSCFSSSFCVSLGNRGLAVLSICSSLSFLFLFYFLLLAEGELSRFGRPPHWRQKSSREDFLLVENVNVNWYGKSSQIKFAGRCSARARGPAFSSRIRLIILGRAKCLKHILRLAKKKKRLHTIGAPSFVRWIYFLCEKLWLFSPAKKKKTMKLASTVKFFPNERQLLLKFKCFFSSHKAEMTFWSSVPPAVLLQVSEGDIKKKRKKTGSECSCGCRWVGMRRTGTGHLCV